MTYRAGLFFLMAAMLMSVASASIARAEQRVMPTGGRTSQPIGHYEFCQREPEECRQKTQRQATVKLTRKTWSTLVAVNDAVNSTVEPLTDLEIWGKEEVWSFPTNVGDCEDYVLEKRRRLMALGIPAGSLLITVVRQPNGDGHAVLTVRTNQGDFILDNLETDVKLWNKTAYTYLKRQSERNSGAWVAIDDSRATVAVGSVR